MKKYAFLAIVAALALVVSSVATGHEGQALIGKAKPGKRDKKKFKPGLVDVTVLTETEPGQDTPAKANNTAVHFNKNFKFKTKSTPTCNENLENTTTEQAKDLCGKSQVSKDGKSAGEIILDTNGEASGGGATFPVVITGFNGPDKNQLTLHSRVPDLSTTAILVGTLRKSNEKGFSRVLDVPVPPIGGGIGAISSFRAVVKSGTYVQVRCAAKKDKFRAISTYSDGHDSTTANTSRKCKRK